MPAYLVMHRRAITNPDRLKEYAAGIDDTISTYNGRVLARADGFTVLAGQWQPGAQEPANPERVTVIEFPDMESLMGWYDGPEYAPLRQIREASAESDIVAIEGK